MDRASRAWAGAAERGPAEPAAAGSDRAGNHFDDWVSDLIARVRPDDDGRPLVRFRPSGDERDSAEILRRGSVVVKLHARRIDPGELGARLAAQRAPAVAEFWVQPLSAAIAVAPDGRAATVWPRVEPLDPAEPAPWAEAGRLLAELHRAPVAAGPPHGGPARLRRAVAGLRRLGRADVAWLVDLGECLLREESRVAPAPVTWVHGDFHLGQLARPSADGRLLLLDCDDFGVGDPAWDLGRPAGYWASGLLPDDAWSAFLAAYRGAGGRGVPQVGDPWPALDLPARAAVVVAAARELRRDPGGPPAAALLATCRQMRRYVS